MGEMLEQPTLKKKTTAIPKLLNDKGGKNYLYAFINRGYSLYFIVNNFCRKALWVGSCFALMYLFPIGLEYMSEQNRILMKI